MVYPLQRTTLASNHHSNLSLQILIFAVADMNDNAFLIFVQASFTYQYDYFLFLFIIS